MTTAPIIPAPDVSACSSQHTWSEPRERLSPKRALVSYHSRCAKCGLRRGRRTLDLLREAQAAEDAYLAGGPRPAIGYPAVSKQKPPTSDGVIVALLLLIVGAVVVVSLSAALRQAGGVLALIAVVALVRAFMGSPPSGASNRATANRLAHAAWNRKTWRGNKWSR